MIVTADGRTREARFRIWIPRDEETYVRGVLGSAYPGSSLAPVGNPAPRITLAATVRLARDELLLLKTHFSVEPLAGVIATLARAEDGEEVMIDVRLRPASDGWRQRASMRASRLREGPRNGGYLGLTRIGWVFEHERRHASAIEEKAATPGFDCAIEILAASANRARSRELMRGCAGALRTFAGANELRVGTARVIPAERSRATRRGFPLQSFVLGVPELAGVWHLPQGFIPSLAAFRVPALPPPAAVRGGGLLIGLATWAGEKVPVRLGEADARHHLHLLGATGTGKSTALLNLAAQDIRAGRGVAVLDPKGDLIQGLLARIPRSRVADVILIGPEDNRPVGINPLELSAGDDPELVAENTLTIFKRIYERFWGMRTDDILKSSLLTVLRTNEPTLAHIPTLLTVAAFRRRITQTLHDPLGLDGFWRWYEGLTEAQRGEAIGPVLNKLRDFLIRPRLRRLLCQPRSTVDLGRVVNDGKILLADLNVGRWGETAAALVGSFLVARIWQAVLARSTVREEDRPDFHLYIDEFQNFLGIAGPFADALAQARSLRLALTIANQHLGQLPRDLREAVRSNARSRLVFQCGQDDASALAREYAPLDAQALMSLGRFEAAARLCLGGQTSLPFTLRTFPPTAITDAASVGEVVAASREHFGAEQADIDARLERVLGVGSAKDLESGGEFDAA